MLFRVKVHQVITVLMSNYFTYLNEGSNFKEKPVIPIMLIAEMATLQTLASLIIAFTVVRAVSLTDKSVGQN